jgi:flagellar protein FlgJ
MDPISTIAAGRPQGAKSVEDLRRESAAKEFEAVFLGLVVNEMMKDTMPTTMGGGQGESMFRSYLGNAIGEEISESGGIGIARSIESKMKAYGE